MSLPVADTDSNSVTMRRLLNFVAVYDRLFQADLMSGLNMQGYLADNMPLIKKKLGDEVYDMAAASTYRIPYFDLSELIINHKEMVKVCPAGQIEGVTYAGISKIGNTVVVATDRPTLPEVRSKLRAIIQPPLSIQIVTGPVEQLRDIAEQARVVMAVHDEGAFLLDMPRPMEGLTAAERKNEIEYLNRFKAMISEWEKEILTSTQQLPKVN